MQTIDEAREHCRFVGKGIEKMVADGEDLGTRFEGTQMIRIKVDKDGNDVKVAGGFFRIKAHNLSPENRYIQSVTLNGRKHKLGYIEYDDIVNGGELVYEMGPEPAVWYK